ncbi:MAG: hydrogenase formation protein HypD [Chloroflexi bacterium]|nr:MAG: hydrogenase formation protein HypD [Chloroflexota bacterium]
MKYIDEFRNPELARKLVELIHRMSTRPVKLMEFCGGHTHAILKYGIRQLMPPTVKMLSGPGCPVCVTDNQDLDFALALAHLPDVIITTFGDMMRVPGSYSSLFEAKAEGADVRMVYSTLDALEIARANPGKKVVFLGVGFETTAPTVAASILQAQEEGIRNYFVLSMHKLTPPATKAILDSGEVRLDGVIGPGHVTTVIGWKAWEFLPQDYGVPCAVAGFEPLDILKAIAELVRMLEEGSPAVVNAYTRSVTAEGNLRAQEIMYRVFEVGPARWRGLGELPASGLLIREEFAEFDARRNFQVEVKPPREHKGCRCGDILRGVAAPPDCPLFRRVCTPENPMGPCMVSSEGACAAYFAYGE